MSRQNRALYDGHNELLQRQQIASDEHLRPSFQEPKRSDGLHAKQWIKIGTSVDY